MAVHHSVPCRARVLRGGGWCVEVFAARNARGELAWGGGGEGGSGPFGGATPVAVERARLVNGGALVVEAYETADGALEVVPEAGARRGAWLVRDDWARGLHFDVRVVGTTPPFDAAAPLVAAVAGLHPAAIVEPLALYHGGGAPTARALLDGGALLPSPDGWHGPGVYLARWRKATRFAAADAAYARRPWGVVVRLLVDPSRAHQGGTGDRAEWVVPPEFVTPADLGQIDMASIEGPELNPHAVGQRLGRWTLHTQP